MKIKKETAIKILAAMITLLMVVACLQSTVFANGDLMDPKNITATSSDASKATQNVAGIILGIVQIVAVAVAVIMLIVLAIKYISSAPDEKASIKKSAVTYVVGAVLLFGASGVLGLIKGFADSAFKNSQNG